MATVFSWEADDSRAEAGHLAAEGAARWFCLAGEYWWQKAERFVVQATGLMKLNRGSMLGLL